MTTSEPPPGAGSDVLGASVPDDVRQTALSAFAALDPSARVLPLTSEQLLEGGRHLVFRDEDTTVEVDVVRGGAEDGLVRARVSPDLGVEVALQVPGGPSLGLTREDEVHVLRSVPEGPVALVLEHAGTRRRTAWSAF